MPWNTLQKALWHHRERAFSKKELNSQLLKMHEQGTKDLDFLEGYAQAMPDGNKELLEIVRNLHVVRALIWRYTTKSENS